MAKIRKKKQPSKIDNLTILTNWLIGKNVSIAPILEDTGSENNYKYRLFSYLLRHPKLIHYINSYLNNLYTFNKYDFSEWLETFKLIFTRYNIISNNNVYFSKFKIAKRISVKTEFEEYILNELNYVPSEAELNNLFQLYNYKIISEEKLHLLKELNAGKSGDKKQLPIVLDSVVKNSESTPKINSEIILNFNDKIKKYISHRILCKNCPLFPNEKYIVQSNLQSNDDLDVIIIGEYPESENLLAKYNYIHELIKRYNLKYLVTNLVVCAPTGDEIPNETKTIANCKGVTEHIYNSFHSKFKIIIGNKVKKIFNIKGSLTKINGEIINDMFIIAPPSNVALYKQGLIKLNTYLEKYSKTKLDNINIDRQSINSNAINFNSDLKDYSLFDIKIIDEKLLYIFIENSTGNKKYITEEISFPIYLKRGTFQQCEHLSKHCDMVTYLTNQQRIQLNQLMKKRLSEYILV